MVFLKMDFNNIDVIAKSELLILDRKTLDNESNYYPATGENACKKINNLICNNNGTCDANGNNCA